MSRRGPASAASPQPRKGRLALAGLVLGLAAVVALAAAGVGYRFGWWPLGTAFTIAQASAYAAALGFVLSVGGLALALARRAGRGVMLGVLGLAAALVVLVPAAQWYHAGRSSPPINDITTAPQDSPVFQAMPGAGEYPGGETAAQQRAAYADLQPLPLAIPPARAFALARELVEDRGWTVVAAEPAEGRIEAVATTLLYGFEDEVVIRIAPAEAGSVVDLRSRSRIGRGDLGANAARIRSFLEDLRERAAEDTR